MIKGLLDAEELVGSALLSLPTIGSAGRSGDGDPPLILTDDTPRRDLCGILFLRSNPSKSWRVVAGLAHTAVHWTVGMLILVLTRDHCVLLYRFTNI